MKTTAIPSAASTNPLVSSRLCASPRKTARSPLGRPAVAEGSVVAAAARPRARGAPAPVRPLRGAAEEGGVAAGEARVGDGLLGRRRHVARAVAGHHARRERELPLHGGGLDPPRPPPPPRR